MLIRRLSSVNRLEAELMSELENGRLVRLLCKFGFINERPVCVYRCSIWADYLNLSFRFAREPRWSETGDRYIIKLFRDYVFHQVDENGNPVINLSHVLACLNKVLLVYLLGKTSQALHSSTLAQTNVLCSFPAMSRAVSLWATKMWRPALILLLGRTSLSCLTLICLTPIQRSSSGIAMIINFWHAKIGRIWKRREKYKKLWFQFGTS
jgi:hypothetical protein